MIGAKFEFLVTCQVYGKLKVSKQLNDLWLAACVDEPSASTAPTFAWRMWTNPMAARC